MRLKHSFEHAITHYDVIVVVMIPELFTNVVCMMATLLQRILVYVNKRQGTRCMLDTWWGYSCGQWVHMGVSKHIIWIICGF